MACGIEIPELDSDPCKGCITLSQCIQVTEDLTYLEISQESTLNQVIYSLIEKIKYLESEINKINIQNGKV